MRVGHINSIPESSNKMSVDKPAPEKKAMVDKKELHAVEPPSMFDVQL